METDFYTLFYVFVYISVNHVATALQQPRAEGDIDSGIHSFPMVNSVPTYKNNNTERCIYQVNQVFLFSHTSYKSIQRN